MGFLRRAFGPKDEPAAAGPPPRLVQAQPGALIMAAPDCPLCGVEFNPLPSRAGKRNCPACRQTVYVALVDDVGYIVTSAEAAPAEAATFEADQAARDRLFNQKDRGPMQRLNRARLAKWAGLGLWVTIEGNGECTTCRRDLGRSFPADRVVLAPRDDCRNGPDHICLCRYVPTLPAE